jgi:thioredoxin reductase (NADPH)
MAESIYDLLVLGSGPAGLTAGLYGCRAGLRVLILGGDHPGGKVMMHPHIENYPPFPGGVTGTELMIKWVKQVSDELGDGPLPVTVTAADFSGDLKNVTTEQGVFETGSVVVATGAAPRKLGVPGEDDFDGRGVFSCAMCDAPLLRTLKRQRAVVVGGGDTAVHTALGLLPHAEKVTLITRGRSLRAQPILVDRFTKDMKSEIVTCRHVRSISGGDWVEALEIWDEETDKGYELEAEGVFVGIGLTPETGFLNGELALDEEGFILVDAGLATSAPGVYAAGDVRSGGLKQIIAAAADGALAATGAAAYLAGTNDSGN